MFNFGNFKTYFSLLDNFSECKNLIDFSNDLLKSMVTKLLPKIKCEY